MKNAINILAWIAVLVTISVLILTLLTTYQFTYFKYFDSYYLLQWSIFFTMVLFGISMFDFKYRFKNIMYSLFCMILAAIAIFFICMRVY